MIPLLLLVTLLALGSMRTLTPDARTYSEMRAAAARAGWGRRAWWLACVIVEPPALALWYAARTGLYLAAVAVTWAAARLATATAMDGRELRIYRPRPARALGGVV